MSNFIIILLQASINSANGIFCLWLWDGKGAIYFAKREKPLKGWPKGNILMVILAEAERSTEAERSIGSKSRDGKKTEARSTKKQRRKISEMEIRKNMARVKEYHQETGSGGGLAFYFCGWQKCAPGHAFGPAVRPHHLFHLVLSGRGFYERAGKRQEIGPGQGFLILPGESTYYGADCADPWEYCWIGFGGAEAEAILRECGFGEDNLIYEDRSGGLLGREMMGLVDSFGRMDVNGYMLLGRLYLCLSHMVSKQPPKGVAAQEYVGRALDFIHHNFGYDMGVAEIARTVGIHRTYLYRIFMEQLGQSPKEYLTEVRLEKAAEMLGGTGLSVTEIALSCGFREVSLFDRHFRGRYGCAPLKYRRMAAGCPARPLDC